MADPMCGPSTPLQNFQKHSSVDRSLQQDRLVGRASASQGFRSSPGPNAGLVDPEFEAFQAGQIPLDHGFQRQQFPTPRAFQQQQPAPSSWASDFQRLNISTPNPLQQQPYGQQAQQRHDTGGWHQDFARQQQQGGIAEQRMGQIPGQANTQFRYSPMSGMVMAPQYPAFAGQQAEMSPAQQKQPVETFDEEAFARAFEAAAQSEMQANQPQPQTEEQPQTQANQQKGQDIMLNASAERLLSSEGGILDQEPIGADTIRDPLTQDPEEVREQNSPDGLARTAGELLDSVRHDQSAKFANSQFLLLMRQFRDKEAKVEGGRIVSGVGAVGNVDGKGVDEVMSGGAGEEVKVAS